MIIEFLVIQLAAKGIMTKYDQEIQRQVSERRLAQLKMQLADRYQYGEINADQYREHKTKSRAKLTPKRTRRKLI